MQSITPVSLAMRVGFALLVAAAIEPVYAKPGVPLPETNPKRAQVQETNSTAADQSSATQEAPDAKETIVLNVPIPPRLPHAIRQEAENAFDAEALLAPVLNFKLSNSDRANLKASISAVYKGRFADATSARKKIKNKYARKLALWYAYRSRRLGASGEEIEAFRIANPDWPSQDRLRENAERSLFVNRADADTIERFFSQATPLTGGGKAAIAAMHMERGEEAKARIAISEAWRGYRLTDQVEDAILERFSDLLSADDHKARIDRLLLQDRKSRIAAIQRTAKRLPKEEQEKIKARIEVVRRSRKAEKMLAQIPVESAENDIGLYLSRIQWLRRNDKEEEAWTLLSEAPNEPALLHDLDEWWVERRVNCRSALNAGKPELAYAIARDHGPLSGKSYAEAEFLAGWIALRFLNRPDDALKHFFALRTSSKDSKTIARAEYWLGRASLAKGDTSLAEEHFALAGKYPYTYYGQLALQTKSQEPLSLPVEAAPKPTPAEVASFHKRDAVMAIGAARAAGLNSLTPIFLHQLARTLEAPGEAVLLAELGREVGPPNGSVRLGLIAFNRGLPTAAYAFPLGLLPDYKEINGSVESALLHALSRQESEFNPKAKSPVGARGLMQLMPRTARAVARQFNVRYRASKLTRDPSYNMMLGVAHLSDLIDSYDGSYILTLVAYNAGGGRVRDWTEQFGDPRDPDVDPIDWVERIPFTETREYVQKILTTVQIFRSRIEGPDKALRLLQDLNRLTSDDEEDGEATRAASAQSN